MNNALINMKKQTAVTLMRMMLTFPAFVAWSGFIYPEMVFNKNVGVAYTAEHEEREDVTGMEFYRELFHAEPEQIKIKSRLFELLKELMT